MIEIIEIERDRDTLYYPSKDYFLEMAKQPHDMIALRVIVEDAARGLQRKIASIEDQVRRDVLRESP